ncbi:NAD(P)-binding protein [Myriangium duriaei CBS 260.36]|uniref:NAD(P)-binding protein n=1 Tax=Myriangium duriaei CBS 260.36 TaxID=1168546 RepID=A0A9P4J4Y6_9PEZI|nr:NAD(P)-binding protein [Myriangium duriaei CBS 260.36]
MKVLLLGATGNLGSRLVPALLTHGHSVVAYVRSANKLESLLPGSVYGHIITVQGDAMDTASIKKAIVDNRCDAVINTAGMAAMAPWNKSDLPAIFAAVLKAVREASAETKSPLRAWFLGGIGVLYWPGTETLLSNYAPVFLEHRQDLRSLQALPPNTIQWSMLCPGYMIPESSTLDVPTKTLQGKLVASASSPPLWKHSWFESIPLLGRILSIGMNFSRYETTLEQAADFIASDLETRESRFIGKTVGIIDASK